MSVETFVDSAGPDEILLNPIALRKTKIAYNFVLFECNRVNEPFHLDLLYFHWFLNCFARLNFDIMLYFRFDDEGYGAVNADVSLLTAGFIIVFSFVILVLGKFNLVEHKVSA